MKQCKSRGFKSTKSNNFDVSVLMFSYRPTESSKRWEYIRQSLVSLRAQTGLRVQAVVLDDGSNRPLPEEWLADTDNVKVDYYYYKENRGKHVMMDCGLPMLKAPLATTLHDDDYYPYTNSLLTRYMGFIDDNGEIDPSVAFVFTNARYDDEVRGHSYQLYPSDKIIEHSHSKLLQKCYICGAAYMVPTQYLLRFRAHPSLKHAEEYDFELQLSKHARNNQLQFKYISDVTAVYRMHREQTWHSVRTNPRARKSYLPFIRERNK